MVSKRTRFPLVPFDMKIAVVGCSHGKLDDIYAAVNDYQLQHATKIDLLLLCGDVQAVRNQFDLESLACPPKYRHLGDFHEYYSGVKQVPVLTLFIGGNHEAMSHCRELYYGGWVCPNMYFMGYAGVLRFRGLRLSGLSGIYKRYHYHWGHVEQSPFTDESLRSAYHVRSFDVQRLQSVQGPLDVVMSHDWPKGIEKDGDLQALLRMKPYFREDVEKGVLGSVPARLLLDQWMPRYWLSGHMHVRYQAIRRKSEKETRFLALDKCLPRRSFLDVIDVEPMEAPEHPGEAAAEGDVGLEYDEEWLAIVKATASLMPFNQQGLGRHLKEAMKDLPERIAEARYWIQNHLGSNLKVPCNFGWTAPVQSAFMTDADRLATRKSCLVSELNADLFVVSPASHHPQTVAFCQMLDIPLPFPSAPVAVKNPDEIVIEDSD